MTRKLDEAIIKQRREYTDYFHFPGCYGDTTNLSDPPEDMSTVNKKVFEVFKHLHQKTRVFDLDRHGQVQTKVQDWIFFRFTLKPLDPTDESPTQPWLFTPLDKYKPKAMVPTVIRMELMTSAMARYEKPVVFVRTYDSRVAPIEFLDSQRIVQGFRTKAVAKALTGIEPVGNMHAELLIDAAIERNIIMTHMKMVTPLPDFWKLPAELRGRIFQLAAEAEGNISPISIETYHRDRPGLLLSKLHPLVRSYGHALHGENLVFVNGFILPKSVASIVPSYREDGNFSTIWYHGDTEHETSSGDDKGEFNVFATPALLRTSKLVREEAIKVLFVQPTFCFTEVSHLHKFVTDSLDDTISSLRKMRLSMSLRDVLVVFSIARRGLTFDELEALDTVFDSGPVSHARIPVGRRQPIQRRHRGWEKRFDENDAVFLERADSMRFTQLTVEVRERNESLYSGGFGTREHNTTDEKQTHLGRLLLVKLINLTLDSWAQKNGSRPQLQIIWPHDLAEDKREALAVMGTVYMTTEVTCQS